MSEIIKDKKVTLEQLNIAKCTLDLCLQNKITIDDICECSLSKLKELINIDNIYLKELVCAIIDSAVTDESDVIDDVPASHTITERRQFEEDLRSIGLNATHCNWFNRAGYYNINDIKGLTLKQLRDIRGIGSEAIMHLYEHGMINAPAEIKDLEDFLMVMEIYGVSKRVANILWFCRGVRSTDQIRKMTREELLHEDNVLTRTDVNRLRTVFPYEEPKKAKTTKAPLIVVGSMKAKSSSNGQMKLVLDTETTPLSNLFLHIQLRNKLLKCGISNAEDIINADVYKLAADAQLSSNQINQLIRVVQDLKVNMGLGFNYTLVTMNDSYDFYMKWLNMVKSSSSEMDAYRKLIDRLIGYCKYVINNFEELGLDKNVFSTDIVSFINGYKESLMSLRDCSDINKPAVELTKAMGYLRAVLDAMNKYCENTFYVKGTANEKVSV